MNLNELYPTGQSAIKNGCGEICYQNPGPCDRYDNLTNYAGVNPGDACRWQGSVDVEDLARVFSSGQKVLSSSRSPKIQHTRHHRVFKAFSSPISRLSTTASAYEFPDQSCNSAFNDCYNTCANKSGGFVNSVSSPQLSVDDNFGIPCTEAQWLSCPVTQCPIIDDVVKRCPPNSNAWQHPSVDRFWESPCDYMAPVHTNNTQMNLDFYQNNNFPDFCPLFQDNDQQCLEEYLNNEKRKERCRDAARYRRSRETDIFLDLAAALPISKIDAANLDKASVMRLAIAYVKIRSVANALEAPTTKTELVTKVDLLFPKALNGFILVLSNNGDMVYLSENVSEYLGISQMEMLGQNIYEYSHPCDHDELRNYLLMKPEDISKKGPCNFFLRLKCTLTSRGRKVNLKSASYKVIHCVGRPIITQGLAENPIENLNESYFGSGSGSGSGSEDSQDSNEERVKCPQMITSLVIVGCPIPHPCNIEIPLGRHTFLSKHNLNMKFTYVDEKLTEYFGWSSKELIGHSVFEFHHALDNSTLEKAFKTLFSKGQCETVAYRFLGQTGGYAWVVTQATVIQCSKQRKPMSVVCVNHILSGIECKDEVYSVRQLESRNIVCKLKHQEPPNAKSHKVLEENLEAKTEEETKVVQIQSEDELKITSNVFPEPVPSPFVPATLLRDQILESKKEWLFQDKPVVDYEPGRQRGDWVPSDPKNNFSTIEELLFSPDQGVQLSSSTSPLPLQTATASIFAPRTEDMNKGFLTFSEDQPGLTMLKDEPEDLTHLAPTPGDACVPLEDTPFLSDMFDDFILSNENYCSLLSTSLPNDLQTSDLSENTTKKNARLSESLENDPFFYRDTNASLTCGVSESTKNLLSPLLEHSPESQSVDSLRSTETSTPVLGSSISDDDMLMLSITDVIADEELALRAPYIPMSDQDEALQLLISDDMVMWGPTQPPDKRFRWDTEKSTLKRYNESSLAKLLKNDDLDKDNSFYGNLVDPVHVLGQTSRQGTLERSSKRLHGPTSLNAGGEKKRMKCNEPTRISSNSKTAIDSKQLGIDASSTVNPTTIPTTITNAEMFHVNHEDFQKAISQGQPLLLQQLMADRNISNGINASVTTDDGNEVEHCHKENSGGGGEIHPRKPQSDSVLMNLLVSGCDKIYGELPTMSEEKLPMPLLINVDINDQSSLTTSYQQSDATDSTAPIPKKFSRNSVAAPIETLYKNVNSNSMYIDNFSDGIENYSPNLLSPRSELLKVLSDA